MFDLADAFVKMGGKYLFIDEIYKNKDWSKELNLIYDYHSKLDIVFTGSSVLDIFESSRCHVSDAGAFFLNQTRIFSDVVASPVSDFLIDDMTFEVGGKKKGQKQIQGVQKGFVVKDDIERGFMNVVPLWQFGMGY